MGLEDVRDVIVIGGGPAGYTAALYAARANLEPLVIEGFLWGGQLMVTSEVESYPGYPDGISGPELMADLRRQAERFGSEFITDDATRVDLSQRPFRVWVGDREYRAHAMIVATGASARWLGLPCEQRLQGRGVSACATCDGAFFRDQDDRCRWRRRFGNGRGAVLDPLRQQGHSRSPPRRVPCVADHARTRSPEPKDRARHERSCRRDSGPRKGRRSAVAFDSDQRDPGDPGPTVSSLLSATTQTPNCSSINSTATKPATSRPSRTQPRRTFLACSRRATSGITRTVRRSPPLAPAAWRRWTPSASSPPGRVTTEPP